MSVLAAVRNRRRFNRQGAVMVLTAALLAGCGGWFGEDKDPLPGERISVLLHERSVEPDPDLAQREILLPPPSPNVAWPMEGGYSNHAMHHIEVGNLQRAWSVRIGDGAASDRHLTATPVVGGGIVFAMDAGAQVSAFQASDGKRLWSVDLNREAGDDRRDGHFGGGMALEFGRLYVTTGFARVFALEATTGKILWQRPVDGVTRTAPTVRGERVFLNTLDNRFYALDGRTGDELWNYHAVPEIASILGGAAPAADDEVVIAPFSSGELAALRVDNGRPLWDDSLATARRIDQVATLADIRGRPVIDRGLVIATSHGGLTVAIDVRTGRRVWEREVGALESPWVAGDYIFLLTVDSELICMSRADGRVFWVTSLPRYKNPDKRTGPVLWTGPILVSDRLIVAGSSGEALAISPYSGRILGRLAMPDRVSIAPVVADRTVYILSDNAQLVALR